MRALRLAFLCALLVASVPASLATPSESRPIAAAAHVQPGGATLTWVPGPVVPDYFVIYGGEVGADLSAITTAPPDAVAVSVPAMYPRYAVAAVIDGVASEPTVAVMVRQCATIETNPPGVYTGECPKVARRIVMSTELRVMLP